VRYAVGLEGGFMAVTHVWIEEGCITCGACEATCAAVFEVGSESSQIRGEVRADGRTSPNREERSALTPAAAQHEADMKAAASGCPMEVIKLD
jgi:ferredoxin